MRRRVRTVGIRRGEKEPGIRLETGSEDQLPGKFGTSKICQSCEGSVTTSGPVGGRRGLSLEEIYVLSGELVVGCRADVGGVHLRGIGWSVETVMNAG